MARRYWLFRTEPGAYAWEDLEGDGRAVWDGIRNYEARNFLRDRVRPGDRVLVAHSGVASPAVVGIAEVVRGPFPDPTQFDPASAGHDPASRPEAPRWFAVEVRPVRRLPSPVPLKKLRMHPRLKDAVFLKRGRLSVVPLTAEEFRAVVAAAGGPA